MSLALASVLDQVPCTRAGVPVVPSWTAPRPQLDRKLDRGSQGVLTVVTGPSGSGKTLGVAGWAAGQTSPSGIVWVNLNRAEADPERMWRLIRTALHRAGERNLPAMPTAAASERDRDRALVAFGEALSGRAPWTVVLDGFPTGAPSQLARELEIVLDHSARSLRVVLLGHGAPAVDLHRYAAAGELVQLTAADLLMDADEVADVLRLGNAPHDSHTVSAVASHTFGWACGVRLAALSLESAPDLTTALHEAGLAIDGFLTHEVLGRLTAPVRRLLVWTSLEQVVAPGAALAALGTRAGAATDRMIDETGLVERLGDGSLVCHPLLRAAAHAELVQGPPGRSATAHRPVAQWYADHGAVRTAVDLCLAVRDWGRAADLLVESHAVPRLVAGTADDATLAASCRPQLQAAEPLLVAALALRRQDGLAAELALAEATSDSSPTSAARRYAGAFVQLGIVRLDGRAPADASLMDRSRGLLAESAVAAADDLTDLSASLDAFTGAVEVSTGDLDRALVTLSRGAERSSSDCAGQLAVLNAYRGDLRAAEWHARLVLSEAIDDGRAGLAHAGVAMAWVKAERGVCEEPPSLLGESRAGQWASEPWLLVVREVLRARVLIASGRPDEATRLLVAPSRDLGDRMPGNWLVELVTSVAAEAFLASGEPQQALALVTRGLPTSSPDRAVLTARACCDIGDLRGAGAAMASAHELHVAPRATQLQGWVLQARLAHDRGQAERAAALVERALRAAADEENRRALASDATWLRWFLDREGTGLREFRPFVMSMLAGDAAPPRSSPTVAPTRDGVLEPLTERERQVLELLAQMCSTDEIAAELFVSANTVKTHLKGIFRKYSVNRRVDAVRRGRELGLC